MEEREKKEVEKDKVAKNQQRACSLWKRRKWKRTKWRRTSNVLARFFLCWSFAKGQAASCPSNSEVPAGQAWTHLVADRSVSPQIFQSERVAAG